MFSDNAILLSSELLRYFSGSQIKRYKLYLTSIQENYSKHIDIFYHYIRDLIENKQVKLYYIDGKENLTDILTKILSQVLFSHFHLSLSLKIL